jgi:hypothetical protein
MPEVTEVGRAAEWMPVEPLMSMSVVMVEVEQQTVWVVELHWVANILNEPGVVEVQKEVTVVPLSLPDHRQTFC